MRGGDAYGPEMTTFERMVLFNASAGTLAHSTSPLLPPWINWLVVVSWVAMSALALAWTLRWGYELWLLLSGRHTEA